MSKRNGMTNEEALKKARKLYGRKVQIDWMGSHKQPVKTRYEIHGDNDGVYGEGDSWESAFEDAASKGEGGKG